MTTLTTVAPRLADLRALLRLDAGLCAGTGLLAEVATIALVAAGAFSLTGAVVALAVAALVGGLGVVQLRAARRC